MLANGDVFARLVLAIQPYSEDVVLIGGWVHAVYLHEAEARARVLRTDDIDLTIPHELEAGDRPTLVELIRGAGFEVQVVDEATGILEIYRGDVDLDLLTEAPNPRVPVMIEGQGSLVVPGYPYQDFLRENTRWIVVGSSVHPSLSPARRVKVPVLPAYAIGKILSSDTRASRQKLAKDVLYVVEILRSPNLRRQLDEQLAGFIAQKPAESNAAAEILDRHLRQDPIMNQVTELRVEASGYGVDDPTPVRAEIIATLRRFLGELRAAREAGPAEGP